MELYLILLAIFVILSVKYYFSKPKKLQKAALKFKVLDPINVKSDFTVATYNTLADCYVEHHTYASPQFLKFDYRFKLICQNIVNLDSDFLALQEIDRYDDYDSFLKSLGYESVYIRRGSQSKKDGQVLA